MTFKEELQGGYYDKVSEIRSTIKSFLDAGWDFAYIDYSDEDDMEFKLGWVYSNGFNYLNDMALQKIKIPL